VYKMSFSADTYGLLIEHHWLENLMIQDHRGVI
jgi:hypothetical protein